MCLPAQHMTAGADAFHVAAGICGRSGIPSYGAVRAGGSTVLVPRLPVSETLGRPRGTDQTKT